MMKDKTRQQLALHLPRAYSVTSEGWILKLINVEKVQDLTGLGLENEKFEFNEGKVKFLKQSLPIKLQH